MQTPSIVTNTRDIIFPFKSRPSRWPLPFMSLYVLEPHTQFFPYLFILSVFYSKTFLALVLRFHDFLFFPEMDIAAFSGTTFWLTPPPEKLRLYNSFYF
jgi:hypothetical protein